MPIRKRKTTKAVPATNMFPSRPTYVRVYRVGPEGLSEKGNKFFHKGPAHITFLHVADLPADAADPLLVLYERLKKTKFVGTHPGRYIAVSDDAKLTTNFWITPDKELIPGFVEYKTWALTNKDSNGAS